MTELSKVPKGNLKFIYTLEIESVVLTLDRGRRVEGSEDRRRWKKTRKRGRSGRSTLQEFTW